MATSRRRPHFGTVGEDCDLLVILSRDGGPRKFETKAYKTPSAAKRELERIVTERIAEGFVEVDAKGAPRPVPAPSPKTAKRWEFRRAEQRRLIIVDGAQVTMASPQDLRGYAFKDEAAAVEYVNEVARRWKAEGLVGSGPEEVAGGSTPLATRFDAPPDLDGGPFCGTVRISKGSARIVFSCDDDDTGPSLDGFREVLDKVRRAGATHLEVEARD